MDQVADGRAGWGAQSLSLPGRPFGCGVGCGITEALMGMRGGGAGWAHGLEERAAGFVRATGRAVYGGLDSPPNLGRGKYPAAPRGTQAADGDGEGVMA